jgi:acetylornithine deacetylase
VLLQSVVEEEAGGGAGTLVTLLCGHGADALITPEPFYHTVVLGQPGVMLFRVSVVGKTAHATYSQTGVNAIGKMLPLYQAMVERAERWPDPFFGGLSDRAVNLNIGTLHAGDWPSTVAGRAEMECRVAFIPPQTREEVRREVEDRIAAVAARDPWRQDAAHPFVTTLADVATEVTGERPPLVAATAGLAACIGARGDGMHGIDE